MFHRLHKCQACHKWGCKSCNHRPPGQVDFTKSKVKPQGQAHVASTIAASSGQSASCENGPGFPQSDQALPSPDLTNILSSMHNFLHSLPVRIKKLERPPIPTPLVASLPSCPKTRVCLWPWFFIAITRLQLFSYHSNSQPPFDSDIGSCK